MRDGRLENLHVRMRRYAKRIMRQAGEKRADITDRAADRSKVLAFELLHQLVQFGCRDPTLENRRRLPQGLRMAVEVFLLPYFPAISPVVGENETRFPKAHVLIALNVYDLNERRLDSLIGTIRSYLSNASCRNCKSHHSSDEHSIHDCPPMSPETATEKS